MKYLIALLLSALSIAATATEVKPPKPTKQPVRVNVVQEVRAEIKNILAQQQLQQQQQAQQQQQGQQAIAITEAAKASAPPAYAPPASTPLKDCRYTIGLGFGTPNASGSGGVPIGNGQICITETANEILNRQAARGEKVAKDDYLINECKVEGMAETSVCKAFLARQPRPQYSRGLDPVAYPN